VSDRVELDVEMLPVLDGAVEPDAGDLGRRLRQLRRARGLSLSEVAAGTGVSASFLSMVEKGKSDITISRLMRIVNWFGISIADLVGGTDHPSPTIVRADERQAVHLGDERLSIYMLSTGRHAMMPVVSVYAEGGGMADRVRHDGEEFVYVLSGTVELSFGDSTSYILRAGDSAHYRADVPHLFRNAGRGVAKFLGVTTPPNL
jgi:transcriptional regulator with XRE-family HTH domain